MTNFRKNVRIINTIAILVINVSNEKSVGLHTLIIKNGVAYKFYETLTDLFKVKKQLSNVTYEIDDMANKKSKVVHFDCLILATVKHRVHKLSESELECFQAVLRN